MIIGEFCDVYPPQLDGVGTVVRAYAEELSKTQEACYYIAPKAPTDTENPFSFPVINYTGIKIPKEAYRLGLPGFDIAFKRDIRKIDFDIIHAHSPFTAGMEALWQSNQHNIPLVGTFHSKYYDDIYSKTHSTLISSAGAKLICSFFDKCDEVWSVNNATADVLHDYGYKGEIVVMPNGTDLWYPTAEDKNIAQQEFGLGKGNVFLFVGQHNFKKNTRHIIEAIKIYAENYSDFKMVFVGQGPDSKKMEELSNELGLSDKIIFTGHIMNRKTIMRLYARADLLVFPSLYDNAPMVVREAAAAGTPSILVKGSCAAEGIKDGYNGFLCEDSPADIAQRIHSALPVCTEVGVNARNTIPTPWSKIIEEVVLRYQSLIDSKKAVLV